MLIKLKKIKENNKTLLTIAEILIFPIIMILLDIIIKSILNMGTYFGTFLRGVFEYFI